MPSLKRSVCLMLLCAVVLHVHAASRDVKGPRVSSSATPMVNPLRAAYESYRPAALRRPPTPPHHRGRAAGGAGTVAGAAVAAVTTTPRRAPPLGKAPVGDVNPLRAAMHHSVSTHSSHHGEDSMGRENVFLSSIVESVLEAASECTTHKGTLDADKFVPKLEVIYAEAIAEQTVPEQIKTCKLLLAEVHLYAIAQLEHRHIALIEPGQAMIFVAFIHMKLGELEFAH